MTRVLLPALFALAALPAAAQEAATGLTFGGEVKLEYVDGGPAGWALDGDLGMSWRSGGLLGFDAALDSTYFDDGDDLTNGWAAVVLSTGVGEIALGAPRPVLETMRVMPRFSSSRVLDLQASMFTGSLAGIASFEDNGMTPGVTWQQTSGNLTFGAGYHHLNDANVDVAEGVMHFENGATTYFITGQFATTPGDDPSIMQIGAFHDADRFDLGAALSRFDISGTHNGLRLYGSFDVMSALTLRGDMLLLEDTTDLYSVSATYSMDNGLFVEGGGTKVEGADEIYDIGVGFKF